MKELSGKTSDRIRSGEIPPDALDQNDRGQDNDRLTHRNVTDRKPSKK